MELEYFGFFSWEPAVDNLHAGNQFVHLFEAAQWSRAVIGAQGKLEDQFQQRGAR